MAEAVIKILQDNPSLLSATKAAISAEAARRGQSINESELTDAAVFDEIRRNPEFRNAVIQRLRERGYAIEPGESAEKTDEPQKSPAEPSDETEATDARRPSRPEKTPKPTTPGPTLKGRKNPYNGLQALQGLYRQYESAPEQEPQRFGASLFVNSEVGTEGATTEMPLGTDYMLGPGDTLEIEISGGLSQRLTRTIDTEGRISLPEAGVVLVGGRTLGVAEREIQSALQRQFKDVQADVSVSRLRRVRIYVVGDVQRPGAYDISPLSTALSALIKAGGPTEAGSFRKAVQMRGGQVVRTLDLYQLMLKGVLPREAALQSGDSILVPTAGRQVTIQGMVRRPAIYELNEETTLQQVVDLAGGLLVSAELGSIKVERTEAHQKRVLLNVDVSGKSGGADLNSFTVKDGDRVTVAPILPYKNKIVYLEGHVFRPGDYAFREGMTVKDLVAHEELLPEPARYAEIVRLVPPAYTPKVIRFDLKAVLEANATPPALQAFDTVRVLGRYEVDAPMVSVFGEVVRPGEYPLAEGMRASDLVKAAGGFKRSAYRRSADLSSYDENDGEKVQLAHREIEIERALTGDEGADTALKPGDVLTIRQIGKWEDIGGSITLAGALVFPGRYGIQEGERLSSVVRRAGGFLADAYPVGAVLERAQVRDIARRSRDQLVRRLEAQQLDTKEDAQTQDQVSQQRQRLIERLRQTSPSGRMVIRISSDLAAWEGTEADVEVRPGDHLFVPKRPTFVLVDGQVYSPSAITYSPGKNAAWYLKQAGGPTEFSNRKDIFVVRANGSVVGRDSGGWWSGGVLRTKLNPGDTLVVPEKVSGGSTLWRDLSQSAQIISALAIAARVATSF